MHPCNKSLNIKHKIFFSVVKYSEKFADSESEIIFPRILFFLETLDFIKDSFDDSENPLNEPSFSSLSDLSDSSELIKSFFLYLHLETILHKNEKIFDPELNKKYSTKKSQKK